MGCPKCQCEEISAAGMCLWCGYQVIAPADEPESSPVETHDSSATAAETATEELPEWRQQLSQRLLSLKQQREVSGAVRDESEIPAHADSAAPVSARPFEPDQSQADAKSVVSPSSEKIIDDITSGQAREVEPPFRAAAGNAKSPAFSDYNEGPMILLSRTLAGLVDLFIIGISTGALIVAADIFSGIEVLGFASIVNFSLLFLLIYFTYSLFFFRASSQTIGMMMTNLRLVTGKGTERPRVGRILLRSFGFLISLCCFGIGLLWALFDQDHRCFHDRLTSTRVVRVH